MHTRCTEIYSELKQWSECMNNGHISSPSIHEATIYRGKNAIWVWDENQEGQEYGQDDFVMRSINLHFQQLQMSSRIGA